MKLTAAQLQKLKELLYFSNVYEINIQFWPDQTAVYISKGGVDLNDFGGSDFDLPVEMALQYLRKINRQGS